MSENSISTSGSISKGGRFHELQFTSKRSRQGCRKGTLSQNVVKLFFNLGGSFRLMFDLRQALFQLRNIKDYPKGPKVCSELQIFFPDCLQTVSQVN